MRRWLPKLAAGALFAGMLLAEDPKTGSVWEAKKSAWVRFSGGSTRPTAGASTSRSA